MATKDASTSTDDSPRYLESRFFEALKNCDGETVATMLADETFCNSLKADDKLALAYVQAVLLNSVELVKILISHGADISESDYMFKENGAMHAARYGHIEILNYLISSGIGVNSQSGKSGCTALHVAVENGKHECIKELIKQPGINMDIEDYSGCTPLMWCAKLRDWKAMQILIDTGCNLFSKSINKIHETALHVAVDNKQAFWKGKLVGPDDIVRCINLLVDSGIDINQCDSHGMSALIYALKSDNIAAVKHLLKLNCDIRCKVRIKSVTRPSSPVFRFPNTPNGDAINVFARDQDILQDLFPLYLAIGNLQIRAVKTLCLSGAQYHRLVSEPGVMAYIARSQLLQQLLSDMMDTPMNLKQTCRNQIRQSLGLGVLTKSAQLDLPKSLQEYLCLSDVDDI